jgi:hypothetical protein
LEKLRKVRPSKIIEGSKQGSLCLEVFKKASQVCTQVDEFHGGTLSHFAEFIKEERTVGILRGEFAKSREPLDLTEVQGRYNRVFPRGSKLRRGRAVDPSHKGRWIYTWNRVSGFRGLKVRKHCNRNREIMKRDIPTG